MQEHVATSSWRRCEEKTLKYFVGPLPSLHTLVLVLTDVQCDHEIGKGSRYVQFDWDYDEVFSILLRPETNEAGVGYGWLLSQHRR